MHVSLTDVLACPRCGPGFGLVLLPAVVEDRRVAEGVLGCANCRERYVVHGGVAEFLVPGEEAGEAVGSGGGGGDRAVRLAALMGLADAAGVVLVAGPCAAGAAELAALVPGVEVVGIGAERGGRYTALRSGSRLPFQSGSLRAVALCGEAVDRWLEEGARVLSPGGRLVLEGSSANVRSRTEGEGLLVVAEEGETLVASV